MGTPSFEPPRPGPTWTPPGPPRTPGKATAALVLGIVGLFICPIVCSVLAIVLGYQAKREIAVNPNLGGEGIAQAGFILGIVGAAVGLVTIPLVLTDVI